MKRYILQFFLCLLTLPCFAQYVVKGGTGAPLLAKDDGTTQVYLLNGLSGAEISYTSSEETIHQWYKYKEKMSDRIPVPSLPVGETKTSTITDVEDGYGYYVDNITTSNRFIWIIDYSRYIPVFNSLTIEESDDKCERIKLLIDIDAAKLEYHDPSSGMLLDVVRDYKLDYSTMIGDENSKKYTSQFIEDKIQGTVPEYLIDPAPLEDTDFTLSGDQFAEYFNMGKEMKTKEYTAIAVEAKIIADSLTTSGNGITSEDGSMSAPVSFTYTAYANEPVATFYTWKIYNLTKSKTDPVSQTTNKILHYTFEDPGRYQVNLEVSDYQSICTFKDSIPDIIISDFMLWVPNAFSPTTSPGTNDVFKVVYKSVIKFNGWIFNRWGNELFHWTDPDLGWDGKYRGKYVPPGAYFYVIEATSADGAKHVKKGDVNIVGGR